MKRLCLNTLWLVLVLVAGIAQGQTVIVDSSMRRIPQPGIPRPTPVASAYRVRLVDVQASIKDQIAKVQISQVFQNIGSTTLEAELIFPMPDDAAISGLTLMVDGKELTGKLLKKEDARNIYEEIVRRRRDPALLEYMGQGLFQTSVFPIPAGAERTVEIRYSQLLKKDSGLIDLSLPIGTNKHSQHPIENLTATIRVEAADQIKTIYSPTHQVAIERPDNSHAVCRLTLGGIVAADDFRLLYGTTNGLVGMNVLSYRPTESEDGYFVMLASPEVKSQAAVKTDRSLVFVVDKSGSMGGKKIEQAKEALKFLINQLQPGDTFNIVAYDSNVEAFRPEMQRVDATTTTAALTFADGIYAGGSTNIDGALQTALKMLVDPKRPSYVLFMTDGLPTVGELNEQKIAGNAKQSNAVNARLFSFGVGFDVNSRLLDRLSHDQRGTSIYVRPNENIEANVSSLYAKIAAPLLTDLAINFEFDTPISGTAPISRTYPRQLSDLFQGEQLVWVGRYKQSGVVKVTLTGTVAGEKKSFTFPATLANRTMDETNGFCEKLWATRRIGEIIDELDLRGQNKELVDELVQLSIKHGIITPYTSFLADEGVSLADRESNSTRARANAARGLAQTDGRGGFEQRRFKGDLQNAPASSAGGVAAADAAKARRSGGSGGTTLDALGSPAAPLAAAPGQTVVTKNAQGELEEVAAVRNVGQKTFFRKQQRWQDSTVTPAQEKDAVRVKQYSKEYFDLAAKHGGTLAKYLAFNEPVLVNLENKTYQIDPADPEATETPN